MINSSKQGLRMRRSKNYTDIPAHLSGTFDAKRLAGSHFGLDEACTLSEAYIGHPEHVSRMKVHELSQARTPMSCRLPKPIILK
jgi:hypothetical protein